MDKISVSLNTGDIVWLMKRVLTPLTPCLSHVSDGAATDTRGRAVLGARRPHIEVHDRGQEGGRLSQLSTGYKNPQCRPGRQVIVHLFEWRWDDIALECKRFLGPRNYCGVQVSPPNEHRIFVSTDPSDPTFRPWWERYQPVSHYLDSRSGSAAEFAAMVATSSTSTRLVNTWRWSGGYGRGSGGSYYNAEREDFPECRSRREISTAATFCPTDDLTIHDYRDAIQVTAIYSLFALFATAAFLDWWTSEQAQNYVQRYIAKYFNELISLGVAGFRIDAAKHMWPQDIAGILNRTHNLIESEFGPNQRPFVYQEVIDLKGNGEPIKNAEYTPIARVTSSTMAE
uniref:alpha-amylase n=1 Tax=Macrostomum lignano TaxID=282301 RepID=A0A1I8JR85_9PLAT